MIKRILTVSAAALMLTFGAQGASAASVSPEVHNKAPAASTATTDGSFKVAQRRLRNRGRRVRRGRRRRGNRGRNIGIGIGLGALALGAAAAAAADDRRSRRSCRRVERRCARRHGWETRRWYNCVEDRGC